MPNLIDLVAKLADAFDRLQIRFAVGGALANNYWGIVRTTQDIDCLIALPAIKYQRFADELHAIGCILHNDQAQPIDVSVPELRKQVQTRKFIECYQDSVRIELFVPAVRLQEEVLRRAVDVEIGNRKVPFTTAEDLILLKERFARHTRHTVGAARKFGPGIYKALEFTVTGISSTK